MDLNEQTANVSFGQLDQDTIPISSYRFGSWRLAISRQPRTRKDLASVYDAASRNWGRTARRYNLYAAYREPLLASDAQAAFEERGSQAQILDCGIGTGTLSLAPNSILPEQPVYHGIDLSGEMLAAADFEMQQVGLTAELSKADILSIPYANESFDFVMGAHILEHLPNPRRALEEMVRVLKPGGMLFVCVTRQSYFGVFIQLRWRTWAITEALGTSWLQSYQLEDVGFQSINFGSCGGAASIALWGRRPASNHQ